MLQIAARDFVVADVKYGFRELFTFKYQNEFLITRYVRFAVHAHVSKVKPCMFSAPTAANPDEFTLHHIILCRLLNREAVINHEIFDISPDIEAFFPIKCA